MRICFIASEIFSWGHHGGFGSLTRTIGRALVDKGFEVFVVTPQMENQKVIERLDGMIILGSRRLRIRHQQMLYKMCEADIYHSQEPYISAYFAIKAAPKSKHIITFQDPRTKDDYKMLTKIDPVYSYRHSIKGRIQYFLEDFLVRKAVTKADALFCQARYIIPKTAKMYGLHRTPLFLPNPVQIPKRKIQKAELPKVCFLARWDPIKRVEIFLDLAKKFPNINFIAIGKATDKGSDNYLREKYSKLHNLEMPGFVSEHEKSKILEESWILVNTSFRECLPVSFLEACAHKCAILSCNNPDDFSDNFGFYVRDGDFHSGLKKLLEDTHWKEKGERGFEYVKEVHELGKVIDQHIEIYNKLLSD